MPERLSPEGEDIDHTNSDLGLEVDEWSDWENDVNEHTASHHINVEQETESAKTEPSTASQQMVDAKTDSDKTESSSTLKRLDPSQAESIENLDIKTQPFKKLEASAEEDMDFFKDMEPVIQKANVLLINDGEEEESGESVPLTTVVSVGKSTSAANEQESPLIKVDSSRFDIKVEDLEVNEDGWDDEASGW